MGQTSSGWLVPHRPCGAPPADEPGARVRILLAEDRDVYREGLFVLLSEIANAEVVGTAVDRKELVHQSTRLSPDVVVAGTSLVLPDGLPALSRLPEAVSGNTVMAAERDTDELLSAALAAGVHGYVPLSSPREDFDAAIQAVAAVEASCRPCHPTSRQELPSGAPPHGQTGGTGAASANGSSRYSSSSETDGATGRSRAHSGSARPRSRAMSHASSRSSNSATGSTPPTGVAARPRSPSLLPQT